MAPGDNNPRVFAQTISLDAWRTEFDGRRGIADLHIDVVFDERGPIGGLGSPVRFRLSLRRAEVRVIHDNEQIIEILPDSVRRAELPSAARASLTKKKEVLFGAEVDGGISPMLAKFSAKAKASGKISAQEIIKKTIHVPSMEVIHWKTEDGYSFKVRCIDGDRLKGQPWAARNPVMQLRDTNFRRKRGESPEVRVEIHCLREDLIIEDIQFTDDEWKPWKKLSRKKQAAAEQYLKDELSRAGFPCGDLNEPFAQLILADVMPLVRK